LITIASKFRRALGEVLVRADSEPIISVDPVPNLPSGHDLLEGKLVPISVSLRPLTVYGCSWPGFRPSAGPSRAIDGFGSAYCMISAATAFGMNGITVLLQYQYHNVSSMISLKVMVTAT
jgi:hypothetical protein